MKISDAVEVYEEDVYDEDGVTILHPKSHAVMIAIKDLTLDELGDKDVLQRRINTVKLGEVIAVDDPEPILEALKDTELGNINERIKVLTIQDVFKDHDVGLLSLISPDTKINAIESALRTSVADTTIYALMQTGLFEYG